MSLTRYSPDRGDIFERFHVNHVASETRTLICLVTLTFDLLTSKLVRIIACGVGDLPTNFGASGTFRFRRMGQHLSDAPPDIATFTFDLGGHGTKW